MRRVNIADPELQLRLRRPRGLPRGLFRFGSQLGAKQTGTSVYELPPGQAVCPYHYEYGEEEWALVLEGRPALRDPDGTAQLEPFDVVFFPMGPEGAHQIRNDTDEPVRLMMWSTVVVPTATAYPDSDKVGIWTGVKEEDLMVRRSGKLEYYDGEGG